MASCGLTILRIVVGIVFLVHGWQKITAMGFHGTAGMFGQIGIPLPTISSAVVILVEFLGGIALILAWPRAGHRFCWPSIWSGPSTSCIGRMVFIPTTEDMNLL